MNDELFSTDQKKQEAVISFTELISHPGWILFCMVADANIENVKRLLEDPDSDHTEDGDNRLRDKLKLYRNMRNMPSEMIKDFKRNTSGIDPTLDPYDSVKPVDKKK